MATPTHKKRVQEESIVQAAPDITMASKVCSVKHSITFHGMQINLRFTKQFISSRYSSSDAVGDLVAGITVGLTVIPQALAYAGIAGLGPAVNTRRTPIYPSINHLIIFKFPFCLLLIPVRLVRIIFGLFCVHISWLLQRCTHRPDRACISAHVPSDWRCLAEGRTPVAANWRHWDSYGRLSARLYNRFRFWTSRIRIYKCRIAYYFDVTGQRYFRYVAKQSYYDNHSDARSAIRMSEG